MILSPNSSKLFHHRVAVVWVIKDIGIPRAQDHNTLLYTIII